MIFSLIKHQIQKRRLCQNPLVVQVYHPVTSLPAILSIVWRRQNSTIFLYPFLLSRPLSGYSNLVSQRCLMKNLCRRSRQNLTFSNSGIQQIFMSLVSQGTGHWYSVRMQPAVWVVGARKDAWLGIRISNNGPLRTLCMNNGNMVCSPAYFMPKQSVYFEYKTKSIPVVCALNLNQDCIYFEPQQHQN